VARESVSSEVRLRKRGAAGPNQEADLAAAARHDGEVDQSLAAPSSCRRGSVGEHLLLEAGNFLKAEMAKTAAKKKIVRGKIAPEQIMALIPETQPMPTGGTMSIVVRGAGITKILIGTASPGEITIRKIMTRVRIGASTPTMKEATLRDEAGIRIIGHNRGRLQLGPTEKAMIRVGTRKIGRTKIGKTRIGRSKMIGRIGRIEMRIHSKTGTTRAGIIRIGKAKTRNGL